ncbi:MAG: glycosyltransferase family 4 protein, partial [Ketobacteraceae bacterium]|nr:glycosyltransferase family 4 protein [Ketobacteraceae bacterium]
RFPLPAGKRRILFAGRLSEEKAPLLFVDAIAELVKTDPDTVGVIAGDGPQAEEVQQAISRKHLQDKIICLGFISNMDQLLPAVDVVMLTSVTEGVPMTMLEAMASGVPVVAAAVGGIPGVIQDASNGLLVHSRRPEDFAAACQRLLSDTACRHQLADQARTTIEENFSLRAQWPLYARLYNAEGC